MKNQPFNVFCAEKEQIRNDAYLRIAKVIVVCLAIGFASVFLVVPKQYWWGGSDAKTPPQLESR